MSGTKKKIDTVVIYLFVFLFLCILASLGAGVLNDTKIYLGEQNEGSYIAIGNTSGLISPGYPLFIKLVFLVLGDSDFVALAYLQFLIGFVAIIYATHVFKDLLKFNLVLTSIMAMALAFPYIGANYGNKILSEALAYPVFLFVMVFFVKALVNLRLRDFIYSFVICCFLVLIRKQFIFMYPVFFLSIIYVFIFKKDEFKQKKLLVISCVLTILFSGLIERGNEYIKSGYFAPLPFTGYQLVTPALYLSSPEDINLFESKEQQSIFKDIFTLIHMYKLNKNDVSKDDMDRAFANFETKFAIIDKDYDHKENIGEYYLSLDLKPCKKDYCLENYRRHYNIISTRILYPVFKVYGLEKNWHEIEHITKDMALKLILNSPYKHIKLYWQNFGGRFDSPLPVILSILGLVAIMIGYLITRKQSYILASFLILTAFANQSAITLVEPMIHRYTLHTDVLYVISLLILFDIIIKRRKAQ